MKNMEISKASPIFINKGDKIIGVSGGLQGKIIEIIYSEQVDELRQLLRTKSEILLSTTSPKLFLD